jgi:NAD(P)H-hydrate epimerase
MARLTGLSVEAIEADRIGVAARYAESWGQIVVLKGAYTVIAAADGRITINPFANAALATAGSGDVLAGMIAGFQAQGLTPYDAAVTAAYIHGVAGELASKDIGPVGVTAGDLISVTPRAIRSLMEPQAASG